MTIVTNPYPHVWPKSLRWGTRCVGAVLRTAHVLVTWDFVIIVNASVPGYAAGAMGRAGKHRSAAVLEWNGSYPSVYIAGMRYGLHSHVGHIISDLAGGLTLYPRHLADSAVLLTWPDLPSPLLNETLQLMGVRRFRTMEPDTFVCAEEAYYMTRWPGWHVVCLRGFRRVIAKRLRLDRRPPDALVAINRDPGESRHVANWKEVAAIFTSVFGRAFSVWQKHRALEPAARDYNTIAVLACCEGSHVAWMIFKQATSVVAHFQPGPRAGVGHTAQLFSLASASDQQWVSAYVPDLPFYSRPRARHTLSPSIVRALALAARRAALAIAGFHLG